MSIGTISTDYVGYEVIDPHLTFGTLNQLPEKREELGKIYMQIFLEPGHMYNGEGISISNNTDGPKSAIIVELPHREPSFHLVGEDND